MWGRGQRPGATSNPGGAGGRRGLVIQTGVHGSSAAHRAKLELVTDSGPPLFDDCKRSDPRPAGHLEDSFTFLNRAAGPYWDSLREGLDRWYAAFPDVDGDLRNRFRKREPDQHFAAWWELYLHKLFTGMGFDVDVHPSLADSFSKPDFALTRGDDFVYVEALTVFSGVQEAGRQGALEAEVKEAIDQVENPKFVVALRFGRVGTSSPRRATITRQIAEWLASLDADAVIERHSQLGELPERTVVAGDWELELRAIPVSPASRGRPDHRVLGIGPATAGYVNDVQQLGRALRRKRKKYGRPDAPLVVAVLSLSTVMTEREVTSALFGSEIVRVPIADPDRVELARRSDGFWFEGGKPAGTRVSAVLLGVQIHPQNCARQWPRLWRHPWASKPLNTTLPFPSGRVTGSAVAVEEAIGHPWELLDVTPDWPGPADPFPRAA